MSFRKKRPSKKYNSSKRRDYKQFNQEEDFIVPNHVIQKPIPKREKYGDFVEQTAYHYSDGIFYEDSYSNGYAREIPSKSEVYSSYNDYNSYSEDVYANEEFMDNFNSYYSKHIPSPRDDFPLENYERFSGVHEDSQDYKFNENYSHRNIDDLVSNLVPGYQEDIAIDLQHVSLSFKVRKEKIDNLKEYVVRSLKRNKSGTKIIQALDDVSFKIYKGEKVGVIGYNGAGKSTLLKVIAGVYKPKKGKVFTNGRISPLLGLNSGFDINFSGRDNIFFNGSILGYNKKYLKSKVDEIIEFSELGDYINIPIKNYSSGMMAKLGFSIAAMVDPDILIIDEVLGVGDINFSKKSTAKMKELMNSGCTVILVSHSLPQIRQNCDKAIWIDNGHVKAIGEVNQICDLYIKDAEKADSQKLQNIVLR